MLARTVAVLLAAALLLSTVLARSYNLVFDSDPRTPRARLLQPSGDNILAGLEQFTACLYLSIDKDESISMTVISYSSTDTGYDNELTLEISTNGKWATLYVGGDHLTFENVNLPTEQWFHLCVSWDTEGTVNLYINGTTSIPGSKKIHEGGFIGGNGCLVLGQDDDEVCEQYYNFIDGFNGKMSQFKMWNQVLTPNEVELVMNCKLEGNLISWNETIWDFYDGMLIEESTDPCAKNLCETVEESSSSSCVGRSNISHYDIQDKENLNYIYNTFNSHKAFTRPLADFPMTYDMSLCFWLFQDKSLQDKITAIEFTGGFTWNLILIPTNFPYPKKCQSEHDSDIDKKVPCQELELNTWTHECYTWEIIEATTVKLYVNGKYKDKAELPSVGLVPKKKMILKVEQEQSEVLDEANPTKGFVVKISDVNVWDRVLAEEEVAKVAECSGDFPGNVLNWNIAEWEDIKPVHPPPV